MAKFYLTANKAWSNERGVVSIAFDFKDHFERRNIEVKTTAEAIAALEAYAKDAEATGKSLVCFIGLARGERSPNGFKKANTKRYVNLRSEDEEERGPRLPIPFQPSQPYPSAEE